MGFDKCIKSCICHYSVIKTSFTVLINPVLHPFNPPSLPAATDLSTVSLVLPFPDCLIVEKEGDGVRKKD